MKEGNQLDALAQLDRVLREQGELRRRRLGEQRAQLNALKVNDELFSHRARRLIHMVEKARDLETAINYTDAHQSVVDGWIDELKQLISKINEIANLAFPLYQREDS